MTLRTAAWTVLWCAMAAWAPTAQAQHSPPHAAVSASNVLSLTASASIEVTMDTLSVTMSLSLIHI